jgi:hypothetical protein
MVRRFWIGGLVLLTLTVVGSGEEKTASKTNGKSLAATPQAGLEQMKKLAGTWVAADKDGKPTDKVVSVVKVTAGGSVVQETLFPDSPMEMVSVYHCDGSDLVMTHYCMLGNQPHMKADPNSPPGKIHWVFAGGTNLNPAKDKHMHEATLTFIDEDHIHLTGSCWENGKPDESHKCDMKLVRKK